MPDLSIVVIHHHHVGIIERCLESLAALPDRASFELLIVDNTPCDDLALWVSEHLPAARLIANPAPLGYAANVNLGMRTAVSGRYVLMLNPDILCAPGLLDTLTSFMDHQPDAGVAAPRLLNPDGTLQPSCRAFPTPLTLALRFTRLDRFFSRARAIRRYLMTDWDHAAPADVDWVTGAAMIFRREALTAVGGLDESYFLYWEDLDLCLRLWRAGWRVCYVPQACATHEHLRKGVKSPFSRFARWQIAGAVRIFTRFGTAPKRTPATRSAVY